MVEDARKTGRPTMLLDEKLQGNILGGLANGSSLRSAAGAAGVDYDTLKWWRRKGRAEPDSIYGRFFTQSEIARERGKHGLLSRIHNAEDWRAQAWILERCHPNEFAQRKPDESHDKKREEQQAIIVVNTGDEKDKYISQLENRLKVLEAVEHNGSG